ncbi:hypothetical protein QQF64_014878 [Cirrhinus molitorella]|uniref:Secreted protein n=1 Tax=Cirrhinus molitorella TaxID=172907 RepID=A0ABR3NTC0_9TELE
MVSEADAMVMFWWRLSIVLNRQAELYKILCLHFCLCCHDNSVHQVCPTQSAALHEFRILKSSDQHAHQCRSLFTA